MFKRLRFDKVMNLFFATGFKKKNEDLLSNGDKIHNFELLTVYFCMGPIIIYCLKVDSLKPKINPFHED